MQKIGFHPKVSFMAADTFSRTGVIEVPEGVQNGIGN
jgi:hypothetical protein